MTEYIPTEQEVEEVAIQRRYLELAKQIASYHLDDESVFGDWAIIVYEELCKKGI